MKPSDQAKISRRQLAAGIGAAALATQLPTVSSAENDQPKRVGNRIAVSTYSYWRYRDDSKLSIEECIDLAADA